MSWPRHGHAPIKMRLVERFEDISKVGDFYYAEARGGGRLMYFAVPTKLVGHGQDSETGKSYVLTSAPIEGAYLNDPEHRTAHWDFTGPDDAPTTEPSHGVRGSWHGWVRNGYLVEA